MALFCRGGQPAPDHWKMSVTAPVGFPSRPSLAVEMVWTQGILLCLCFLTPSVAQSLQDERKDSCENNTVSQGTTFHLQMRPSLFGGSILLVNAAALKLFAAS
ncbi:hypothetical protein Y1Q_0011101 [Alligator mississippiensis]|uniref:Uncharacterized protein n=1 Tax=Alligator mississippiensis TaxID=8496 RepID=A0A151PJA8_ALLMI|nr:hypothetical protein Y1Q_0011101 [Alligator mississippiensis]